MLSTCSVIGEIRVHLATGDAPVTVKRRAVKASSSLKSSLYNVLASLSRDQVSTLLLKLLQCYRNMSHVNVLLLI
jgi:hypothetical protein